LLQGQQQSRTTKEGIASPPGAEQRKRHLYQTNMSKNPQRGQEAQVTLKIISCGIVVSIAGGVANIMDVIDIAFTY